MISCLASILLFLHYKDPGFFEYRFSSAWRTSFNTFYRSTSHEFFSFIWKCFILSSALKNIFTGYRILGCWQVFSFNTLKVLFHCILPSKDWCKLQGHSNPYSSVGNVPFFFNSFEGIFYSYFLLPAVIFLLANRYIWFLVVSLCVYRCSFLWIYPVYSLLSLLYL